MPDNFDRDRRHNNCPPCDCDHDHRDDRRNDRHDRRRDDRRDDRRDRRDHNDNWPWR